MTVAFDFNSMETFFSLNTVCRSIDGVECVVNANIDFDTLTADYFRNEALKYLAGNFKAMTACRIGNVTVSA